MVFLAFFVESDNRFVFTMTFIYINIENIIIIIIYERSRRAVLHYLAYDLNIEK